MSAQTVMEKTVDIDAVMKLAKTAEKIEYEAEKDVGTDSKSCVNIAIAKDEAFCFLYDDNMSMNLPFAHSANMTERPLLTFARKMLTSEPKRRKKPSKRKTRITPICSKR